MRSNLFYRLSAVLCILLISLSSNAQLPTDISTKILGTWNEQYGLGSWTFNANGTITDRRIDCKSSSFDGHPIKATITGVFCSYSIDGQVLKTVTVPRRDLKIEAEVMDINTLKQDRRQAWMKQKKEWIQANIRKIQLEQENLVGKEVKMTIISLSDDKMELKYGNGDVEVWVRGNHKGPMINNHEYVDLGLPSGTLWATCNIGASTPIEYGEKYQFGDITSGYKSKGKFGDDNTWTKYCTSLKYTSSYNYVDNKTRLEPEDDVAHVKWGGSWRIPTTGELKELVDFCSWNKTELGFVVKGKNGNEIFLPNSDGSYDYRGSDIDRENDNWCYVLGGGRVSSSKRTLTSYVRPVSNMLPETKAKWEATRREAGGRAILYHDIEANDATGPVKSITTLPENWKGGIAASSVTLFSLDGKMHDEENIDTKYDANGYLQSFKRTVEQGQAIISYKWENGKLVSWTYSDENQLTDLKCTYTYNESGTLASQSIIYVFGDQKKEEITSFTHYKYDERGNWISRWVSPRIKNDGYLEYRIIDYYE